MNEDNFEQINMFSNEYKETINEINNSKKEQLSIFDSEYKSNVVNTDEEIRSMKVQAKKDKQLEKTLEREIEIDSKKTVPKKLNKKAIKKLNRRTNNSKKGKEVKSQHKKIIKDIKKSNEEIQQLEFNFDSPIENEVPSHSKVKAKQELPLQSKANVKQEFDWRKTMREQEIKSKGLKNVFENNIPEANSYAGLQDMIDNTSVLPNIEEMGEKINQLRGDIADEIPKTEPPKAPKFGPTVTIAEEMAEKSVSNFRKIFNSRTIGAGMNVFGAVMDFNQARENGDRVVKSAAKAGVTFAASEVLGAGAFLGLSLLKSAPQMAISGLETAQKVTRQMNSMQRMQTFGDTSFQDTPQLATMRQAGMELAKMSQYNLQQSIMGNEAQYMHRY